MYECKYPHLFSPIVLGNTLFRNRIFASPTGCQNSDGDGYINDNAPAFYGRKAMGGAASVASYECIVDSEFGRGGPVQICADWQNMSHGMSNVAFAIKSHGAVASMELSHTGMYANRALSMLGAKATGVAYGPVECELGGRTILPMDEEVIARTIRKYAESAALAKQWGFGMVTIHAGHGWMLHQFMSPLTNTRTDKWGGPDIENRTRLTVEVCKAIRKAVGPGFPIEIRMSASEGYDGGYGLDEGIAIAKQLDGYVDLIQVSAGVHELDEVFTVMCPSMFHEEGSLVVYAAEIKKHVKTPIAAIGGLNDPAFMEDIIASGKADVVEMARSLFCDPDLPDKVRAGREKEVRKCMRCLVCFSNRIKYGKQYCSINPECARELEVKYDIPPAIKKKVLVAGGGVGGMQAALTCAARGHEVILCEKLSALGGVLRCEADVSFKKNLESYLDQQAELIAKSPIDLRLNTEVTPEYAAQIAPDVIIAALGSIPAKPRIPGIDANAANAASDANAAGANVMAAQEAYTSIDSIGHNVVIIGAGLVGVELGLHLLSKGRSVKIVEMLDHISDGGNIIHMSGLRVEIKKRGLEIIYNTTVKEITPAGLICETDGVDTVFNADTIVYAVGQTPLREQAISLSAVAPVFQMLGDCVSPRNIMDATGEAFHIARNLGRF